MEETKENLQFDPKKLSVVDTDSVRPNPWNPKDQDTEEFKKVLSSLKANGLRLPIVVRENEGFEIIDGEQRWRACKELGMAKVIIYNEGNITDQKAKELTIWYQQQVPFDEIKLSQLVKEMIGVYPDFQSPFTDVEIQEFIKIADFQEKPNLDLGGDGKPELVDFSVQVNNEQLDVIEQAIAMCIQYVKKEENLDIEKPRAVELICADFMAT